MTRLARIDPHPQGALVLEDYTHIETKPPKSGIAGFVALGAFVISAFIGGAAYWAATSKLDGAVVATATFVVEGNRKTVEHLEGGIVHRILVADGEQVEAGQTLVELDSTDLDVDIDVLESQLGDLMTRRARLVAQMTGATEWSKTTAEQSHAVSIPRDSWRSAYLTQKQLFDAEKVTLASQKSLLDQQISGFQRELTGLAEQRDSTARQLEITEEELADLQSLLSKGLIAAARVNARRIEVERLNGTDALLRTQVSQIENQINELRLAALEQENQRAEAKANELAVIEAQLAGLVPQYKGASERLKRVAITAPVTGRVVGLTVFTKGGVVRPGEPILDIVPNDEKLVIEARVNTADIEKLFIGQSSRVRLSAFDQGDVPEANGTIIGISADSLEDERTGQPYYTARVALDDEQPGRIAELELVPGMPADLFVNTGERTALSYLAQPLQDRLARTFIE